MFEDLKGYIYDLVFCTIGALDILSSKPKREEDETEPTPERIEEKIITAIGDKPPMPTVLGISVFLTKLLSMTERKLVDELGEIWLVNVLVKSGRYERNEYFVKLAPEFEITCRGRPKPVGVSKT